MVKNPGGQSIRRGMQGQTRGTGIVSGGAQRRQVTVLFCDLVRSVELTERLDPEDSRDVLHAYLNAFAQRIESSGGFIARYTGDGIMAYFGYPLAREGDPARAIRAALSVCEAARTLVPPHGHAMSVRCGIATGLTVIGDLVGKGAASERGVIGSAPNLAARLQAVAAPGQVVVCAATARLAAGLFEMAPISGLELKGFAKPETAFAVESAADFSQPLSERLAHRHAPLAGRSDELAQLASAWRRAKSGRLVFVPVLGEAGIGKSRLIYEFQRRISGESHVWLEAAADPSQEGTAYAIARRLILSPSGSNEGLTYKSLEKMLALSGVMPAGVIGPIASLMGLADDEDQGVYSGEDRRRRLNASLVSWLLARTADKPGIIVIEDLQWVDPSTLELVRTLLTTKTSAPLLVIGSSRAAIPALGRLMTGGQAIRLAPLSKTAIGSIVGRIAGPDLAAEGVEALVRRSDGNPLFAEELATHLITAPQRINALPDTLSGLLTARLDATGSAASLARVASVLGPRFEESLLRRLTRFPARRVSADLKSLLRSDLLTIRAGQYAFRHALIHEAAYASLLRDDRRSLHRRAAGLAAKTGASAETIARHWREAGDLRRATDAYRDLGRRYVAEGAHGEAARAYRAAMEMLTQMPASIERDREEMELSSALTNALQITDGYSAPAVAEAAARARTLAERLGESGRLFNQIAAEWMAASSAGDYGRARELAARAMPLAEADGGPETLGTAFMIQMTTAYRVGALVEGEAAYRAGAGSFRTPAFVRRPGAVPQTVGNAAVNAWLLGRAGLARQRNAKVVAHGEKSTVPYVRAFAFYMAAMTYVLMDEPDEAARLARAAMTISDAEGFPQFSATARIVLGRALVMQGRRKAGIAMMQDGLGRMTANRSQNGQTMYLTWLAQSHLENRDLKAARAACDRALSMNPAERFFRAETLRVRALCCARPEQAAPYLHEALALARAIGSGWAEQRVLAVIP